MQAQHRPAGDAADLARLDDLSASKLAQPARYRRSFGPFGGAPTAAVAPFHVARFL